jgi:ATP-dependent helicase/nuclease subunit A
MNFSQSQLEAINTSNKNIVVSASAGAGKTTVLVERLMQRMFKDKISLDEIVAMTFTEAAAANMKKKLLVALNNKLKSNIDEDTRFFCNQQLVLIENALICTMHSFSTTLIKNNFAALSLNPELVNNIIDDITKYRLTEEATTAIFHNELENNFVKFNELNQYIGNDLHNFDTLKKIVTSIFNTAINTIDPDSWFKEFININKPAIKFKDIHKPYRDNLYKLISIQINNIIINLKELADLASTQDIEKAILIHKTIDLFDQSLTLVDNSYTETILKMTTAMNVDIKTIKKYEDYNNLRKEILNNQFPALAGILYNEKKLLDDYNINIEYNCYLLKISQNIVTKYHHLKILNNCMDFNDMEHYAYKILNANNKEVAKKYQLQLKEIMVDEFQDTNDIQNAMINLISNGHNVFRVGDMKQSIYKFRGAKPTIMQSLLKDDDYYNIYLPNNFRSSYNIVEFNNTLFKDLLDDINININFTDDDNQVAELEYQFKNQQAIELVNLQINDDESESLFKDNQATNYIAQDIIKKHQEEGYNFKDFCILVRSHISKIDIKYALNNANIPNFIDDHLGFLNTNANMLITNFFKVILNPKDDISLVSILVSPIYQLSDDDLVSFKSKKGYFTALIENNHQFIEDYNNLKIKFNKEGILALLNQIIMLNNYYHNFTTSQDRANIDLLSSNIESFKSNSLVEYLNYLDIAFENNKDGAIPVSNKDDVVKVMTIHQSKGLEFEVVYIYDPSNYTLVKKQDLSINEKLGIGINHCYNNYSFKNPSIQQIAIDYQNSIEELSEFIRVFYVATTRAKNRLYLISKVKPRTSFNSNISSMINKQLSFQDLIFSSKIINSDLFNYKQITSPFEQIKLKKIKTNKMKIDYYNTTVKLIQQITPSDHKNLELNLDFNSYGLKTGTMIHNTLERIPLDRQWTKELVKNIEPKLNENQIKKILNLYTNSFFQILIKKTVFREFNFTTMVNNTIKTGIVDFISISDKDVNIVDYKTDTNINEQLLIEKYTNQLNEYKKSFTLIYPEKIINSYIYSLTLNKFIKIN